MTCNLTNHEEELLKAFGEVANSTTGKEWCTFDYEGNSNIVRVEKEGVEGLEELLESLDSGKLSYGFVSAAGAGAGTQRKIIMIHWQGEGVPSSRLAQTASHAEAVRQLVKQVHVTIYARNEEDVELPVIVKQLAAKLPDWAASAVSNGGNGSSTTNANGSSTSTPFMPPTPVGSVYTPSKATKDLDMGEREKFWADMRAEEEVRRREEHERSQEQQRLFNEDRKRLDSQLHKLAEARLAAGHLKKAESVDSHMAKGATPSKGQLIAGRTQLFEQKVQELVSSMPKPLVKPKVYKYQVGVVAADGGGGGGVPVNSMAIGPQAPPKLFECAFYVRPKGNVGGGEGAVPTPTGIPIQEVPPVQHQPKEEAIHLADPVKPPLPPPPPQSGMSVRAVWDYQAEDPNELSFDPEEIITDVEQLHEGWWRGKSASSGKVGLFPSNYVKPI